jgi:hypothetical protein
MLCCFCADQARSITAGFNSPDNPIWQEYDMFDLSKDKRAVRWLKEEFAFAKLLDDFIKRYSVKYPVFCKYFFYYRHRIGKDRFYPENGIDVIWYRILMGHLLGFKYPRSSAEEFIDAYDEALGYYWRLKKA